MSNSESESEGEANSTLQEDSSIEGETLNPLLLPPVISNLLKYLSCGDLVRARGVCTLWNEIATSVFNNRSDQPTIAFTHYKRYENDSSILSYLCMLEGSKLTFPSFRFGGNAIFCKALLETFQKSLKKLGLDYSEKSTVLTSRMLRELLLTMTPFLEELELDRLPAAMKKKRIFLDSDSVELNLKSLSFHLICNNRGYSEVFLKDLFKNAPYLRDLKITAHNTLPEYGAGSKLLTILRVMAEHVGQGRVTHLDLDYIDDNILAFLQDEQKLRLAPLQVFKAKDIDISDPNNLKAFLNTHKETLEYLHLGFRFNHLTFPFLFPVLENLKKLRVDFFRWTANFEILDYGLMFPTLEVLEMFTESRIAGTSPFGRAVDLAIFSRTSSPCPSLKYLELPMNLESRAGLRTIARIFPNVLQLNMSAQKAPVMAELQNLELWKCWPNLEKMHVFLPWKDPNPGTSRKEKITVDSDSSHHYRSAKSYFLVRPLSSLARRENFQKVSENAGFGNLD